MIVKFLRKFRSNKNFVERDLPIEIYEEILDKDKEIKEKKHKFQEDARDGSRLTKHRFTL